jgi:hypothetical protein
MATNREMLKEAIAEAKAVKEMAIANAKAALEETFTPQLKSILSAKLQEMEMEEEELDEVGFGKMNADPEVGFSKMGEKALDEEEKMEEGEGENFYEVDLEELLAELNEEEMEENLNEAEEGEEEEEEGGEEESEDTEMEDLSDDEIKSMIEDVIAQMIADKELEAGPEFEAEEGEEMEMGNEEEEEVDLAELLREIEEMEEEPVDEIFGGIKKALYGDPLATFKGYLKKLGKDEKLADTIAAEKDMAKKKEMFNDAINGDTSKAVQNIGGSAFKDAQLALGLISKEERAKGQASGASGPIGKLTETEEELAEALSTIENLKAELNEINLLNAKLLYSNKIFKAKNLNESQKVKVLSSFDKAKNVSEVKIVFETLNEGIKTAKNTIKENLGRASKSTVTPTTTKQPIVESNEVFARMQKLAGLI